MVSPTTVPSNGTRLIYRLIVPAISVGTGAIFFGIRFLVRGSADPFSVDWPLDLEMFSLVSTFLIAQLLITQDCRQPFVVAFGVYFGQLACLLFAGNSEYPVASAIALAVHGLLPALVGAVIVAGIQLVRLRRNARR